MSDRSPQTTYRQIIDSLVDRSESVSETLLREEHIYSRALDDEEINSFTRTLTDEQRELVARICRSERVGGIHDVLADLSWWIDCEDVALTIDGAPMPVDQSGMGLHGDYVGRLDEWQWPTE